MWRGRISVAAQGVFGTRRIGFAAQPATNSNTRPNVRNTPTASSSRTASVVGRFAKGSALPTGVEINAFRMNTAFGRTVRARRGSRSYPREDGVMPTVAETPMLPDRTATKAKTPHGRATARPTGTALPTNAFFIRRSAVRSATNSDREMPAEHNSTAMCYGEISRESNGADASVPPTAGRRNVRTTATTAFGRTVRARRGSRTNRNALLVGCKTRLTGFSLFFLVDMRRKYKKIAVRVVL